jgi:RsiW-degrading membrane proteinase PrsW (M82 family)
MLAYVVTAVCAVALAALVYRYDMYEKEPWPLLGVAFGLGLLGAWAAGGIEDRAIVALGATGETVTAQAALASGVEEAIKLLAVLAIALAFRRHFSDPLDGLIYGAFAGLGAAVHESLFYIELMGESAALIGPEFIRLILHLMLGGIGGLAIGAAWFRPRGWAVAAAAGLIGSFSIHFLWDSLCGIPARTDGPDLLQRAAAVALMLAATLVFGAAVFIGARWSRQAHAPASVQRLWGWPMNLLVRGDLPHADESGHPPTDAADA